MEKLGSAGSAGAIRRRDVIDDPLAEGVVVQQGVDKGAEIDRKLLAL